MSEFSPNLAGLERFEVAVERIEKPWGYELVFARTDAYLGKLLFVRAGEQLSLQFHREKDEVIYVHQGKIELEVGDAGGPLDVEVVAARRSFRFRPGVVHRWRALEDTLIVEASTAHPEDVVRLDDRYGRA